MSKRILVVDDEEDLVELLRVNLTQAGYQVDVAYSGGEALASLEKSVPDLLVLDLMMPDVSGLEVCRRVRADKALSALPIVMLTAKADEVDRIVGFELGADDYVTKPFSPRELLLRVRALLRRSETTPQDEKSELIEKKCIALDLARHRCSVSGEKVELTAKEFQLLEIMMSRSGRVQSRETLLQDVWGQDINVTTRTIDTHVKRLREKLGAEGADLIETVRGVGYRFVE
ncbi:MAG: response regulator transcription factor [Deltaproteobacteria bacterium]|nr:response regulator transcription factor [Deltaproteobacteria bacterium]